MKDTFTRRQLLATAGGTLATGFAIGYLSSNTIKPEQFNSPPTLTTIKNRPKLGDDDAPIKMLYWNDYQCPFCLRFEKETFDKIKTNHIDTGQLQLILQPTAIFGIDSQRAANSAYSVWETANPKTFWKWHNLLYREFDDASRNSGWAKASELTPYAQKMGNINILQFSNAIKNNKYQERLTKAKTEGDTLGFSGVPYFILYKNNNPTQGLSLTGALPYEQFKTAINSLQD